MPGVRLVHNRLRGVMVTLEHPTRKYHVPLMCGVCGKVHERKTYHLQLDGEGAVIVSERVFQRLREAGLPGFTVSNTVANPPPQRISMGQRPTPVQVAEQIEKPALRHLWRAYNRLFAPRGPKE